MTKLKEAFFGAFTHDSRFFVAVGKAGRVLLYDLSGEVSRQKTIPFASGISLSPDSSKIALTSPEHKLCIAGLEGEVISVSKTEAEASDGLWTPDSNHVLIPFWNRQLHVINARTGKTESVKEIGKSPRIQPHQNGFTLTHWRIDEYLYPRIETFDWNLDATAEPVELSTRFSRFGASQQLNYFWGISPAGIEILDKHQCLCFEHAGDVRSASFSPNENEIAIIETSGVLSRRALPSGEVISTLNVPYAVHPLYSPDESLLAVTGQKQGILMQI